MNDTPKELIETEIKPFDALTLTELHACLMLRGKVFVVGQQIYQVPDVDEQDADAQHVMIWRGDELVGTARLLGSEASKTIKVGRVAVAEAHRGKGLGAAMMRAIQAWIGQVPGRNGVMSAQAYLAPWYAELGWVRDGEVYIEADIKHIKMLYTPENSV